MLSLEWCYERQRYTTCTNNQSRVEGTSRCSNEATCKERRRLTDIDGLPSNLMLTLFALMFIATMQFMLTIISTETTLEHLEEQAFSEIILLDTTVAKVQHAGMKMLPIRKQQGKS